MVLLTCIGILGFLLIWLLFSPIILQVDTHRNKYVLCWVGLVKAALIPMSDDLLLRLQLPFWQRDFSLIKLLSQPSNTKKATTPKVPPKTGISQRFPWRYFYRLLKSFRVFYFRLNLDTDDYVTNAYLYPLCHALNSPTRSLVINFQGCNQCAFRIENRLANLLAAFIF